MIRRPGCLRSVRLALALVLALPWSDALASATAPAAKPSESSARSGDGWKRGPESSTPQVLAASWEDIDDADDAQGDRAQAVSDGSGRDVVRLFPPNSTSGTGVGREAADPHRYKSFRRLRC